MRAAWGQRNPVAAGGGPSVRCKCKKRRRRSATLGPSRASGIAIDAPEIRRALHQSLLEAFIVHTPGRRQIDAASRRSAHFRLRCDRPTRGLAAATPFGREVRAYSISVRPYRNSAASLRRKWRFGGVDLRAGFRRLMRQAGRPCRRHKEILEVPWSFTSTKKTDGLRRGSRNILEARLVHGGAGEQK